MNQQLSETKLASDFENAQNEEMQWAHAKHRKLCFAALFLFLSGWVGIAFGSEPLVRIWQTEQGLPQNSVRCILQTKDGYLWIGTEHGLARFDGVRFLVFNSANTPELKSDFISALAEDELGNLWIGSQGGGVVRLNQSGFTNFSTANGLSSDMVNCLVADGRRAILIGTVYGLNRLVDGEFMFDFAQGGLTGSNIKVLARDPAGMIWVGTDRDLWFLRDGVFQQAESGQVPVEAMAMSPSGAIWIGGKAYGLLSSRTGHEPFQQRLPLGEVVALAPSAMNEVWAALGDDSLYYFRDGKPVAIKSAQIEGGIYCLYEDREKNLWVGMNGGGLARLKTSPVEVFTSNDGSHTEMISAVTQDRDGRIWAGGTSGNLALFQDGGFTPVEMENHLALKNPVLTLCASADGALWIGTRGNGLFRWQNGNLTALEVNDNSMAAVITALLEDREGNLWIGTEAEGILRFKDQQVTRYTKRDGFSRDQANCIVQQADGSIWFGTTSAGVNRWRDGRVNSFSRKNGLASDAIQALYADKTGLVWIGTGAGLALFREDRFFTFTSKQGVHNEMISQITEDNSGNIWLGSNRGLFRVARRALLDVADGTKAQVTAVRFGTADGLPSSECVGGRQNATLKDAGGNLWFSTLRGLVRMESAKPESPSPAPSVVLERVLLDDEEVVHDVNLYGANGVRGETVLVPAGGTKLEFHFTATSLRSPEKLLFRYQLEGFDPQWIHVGEGRSAIYTKVPKGNYTFRVAVCSDEGIWGDQTASIKVNVRPEFWETTWFKGGIFLAASATILGVAYLRKSRRRELEQLRLRIAGDLHDDLGSNLSSIALLSRRVQRRSSLPDLARGELEEIEQIARRTTQAIREIIWFIEPERDTLGDLVGRMQEVAAVMLAEVDCAFTVGALPASARISPEFRRNVFLVFKEAINNVVRHSHSNRVDINVAVADENLSLSVRDNGRGFSLDSASMGNGLKQMQLRINRLGGAFTIQAAPGQGCKVELRVELPHRFL